MTILISELAGGGIRSVQRGVGALTTNSLNVTITAVDLNKTFLTTSYTSSNTAQNDGKAAGAATLTTSTNLQLRRDSGANNTTNVYWEVVEFL